MILLDTSVLTDASAPRSAFRKWARELIADGVSGRGAATNVASIAEICVGNDEPETVADRAYRERRQSQSGSPTPATPLPEFFIGAHAEVMGWVIATADEGRFPTYFPAVRLETP